MECVVDVRRVLRLHTNDSRPLLSGYCHPHAYGQPAASNRNIHFVDLRFVLQHLKYYSTGPPNEDFTGTGRAVQETMQLSEIASGAGRFREAGAAVMHNRAVTSHVG